MASFSIGQLAQAAEIHLETIRYYERARLMPPPARLPSGHRTFGDAALKRLLFIKRAQELGFSLSEIRDLLELRAHPEKQCTCVCQQTRQKLREVNEKIQHLRTIKAALTRLTKACSGDRQIRACGILEALDRETKRP